MPGDTGPTIMTKAPQTLAEALEVIRSMHNDLLAFRNPEFDLITPGREGEFDDRVKAVLAHSAPVFKAECAAALPEASSSTKSQSQCLPFGDALKALKAGQRVARTGWNGKGMFVYLVPPASYPVQTGAAKAHFGEGAMVPYNAYMAIKNVDETVSTWVPSVNDCLAEDWEVLA